MAGAVFPIVADVLSWFIADSYSPLSQTISDLAVGDASWLMDLGLLVLALACLLIGVGLLSLRTKTRNLRIAGIATIAIGAEVALIAMVHQYAGTENTGADFHSWANYLLYASFATAALAGASGLRTLDSSVAGYSRVIGWIWVVAAPVYYFWFPSGWAGFLERALAALLLAWLIMVAAELRKTDRGSRVVPARA
nr:DUF998 domain-containing protein [Tianweitania sediminis]